MKTLIIDNYDSFTYILSQYVSELEKIPLVVKNNAITADEILNDGISHIIISPGPGRPEVAEDMGNCIDIIKKCMGRLPILGVCLGHQAIVHALGGKIVRAPQPVHGKKSRVKIDTGTPLFRDLPGEIEAMRYHSLIAERESMPYELEITGLIPDESLVMSIAHKHTPLFGIQFHPESIGTPTGKQMLRNFLDL